MITPEAARAGGKMSALHRLTPEAARAGVKMSEMHLVRNMSCRPMPPGLTTMSLTGPLKGNQVPRCILGMHWVAGWLLTRAGLVPGPGDGDLPAHPGAAQGRADRHAAAAAATTKARARQWHNSCQVMEHCEICVMPGTLLVFAGSCMTGKLPRLAGAASSSPLEAQGVQAGCSV